MRAFSLFLILALTAGCATAPYVPATPKITLERQTWIRDFADPVLPDLAKEALRNNPDIQAVLARVDAARATARVTGAAIYPTVDASLQSARSRVSGENRGISSSHDLSLGASWEVDLWRRISHRHRAALADAEATEADYQAARLLLLAETARGWFSGNASRLQAALAERRVENFEETLQIIENRYQAGLGDALDVRLARENLASARAGLALRRRQLDTDSRALESLLGRYPNNQIKLSTALPKIQSPVPADLKSLVLLRRPDVLAAERRLHAAVERQQDSQRNFLPGFRLTAAGGRSSSTFDNLLNLDNLVWSIVASITQPLFQGGRLQAERWLDEAGKREAVAEYSKTVLNAFREVETALAAEPLLEQQEQNQRFAFEEASRAADLAVSRYTSGLTDIITLLDTSRRTFDAESSLLDIQLQRLLNRVDLYLALGGSFTPVTARVRAKEKETLE